MAPIGGNSGPAWTLRTYSSSLPSARIMTDQAGEGKQTFGGRAGRKPGAAGSAPRQGDEFFHVFAQQIGFQVDRVADAALAGGGDFPGMGGGPGAAALGGGGGHAGA